MQSLAIGVALVLALAIILIGGMYLARPMTAARGFGMPPPVDTAGIAWWLRLKGVRDIASGLVVLAVLAWGDPRMVGLVLLVEAFIPTGDMTVVLAARGKTGAALGMHGGTALVMVLTAIALLTGKGG
jgi:hypothetical protein